MIQLTYDFSGMTPSDWTEDFLKDELVPLAAYIPQTPTMKVKVDRYKDKFEGKLMIQFDTGAFLVEEKAYDLEQLVKGLKRKMKVKISKWRETRNKPFYPSKSASQWKQKKAG